MRARRLVVLSVLLAAGLHVSSAAVARQAATVELSGGAFQPRVVRVDPGGSVTWVTREPGHTIRADDGRFDFPQSSVGEHRTVTVGSSPESVGYYCTVHGRPTNDPVTPWPGCGMCGFVLVGDASPPEPPPPPPPAIRDVPAAYPTIAAAVDDAPPGTIVRLGAGRFHEAVSVDAPSITIRGTPGGGSVVDQILVNAGGVRLEQLTAEGVVAFIDVDGFDVDAVAAEGFLVRRSTHGLIADSVAGSSGFVVEDCDVCDIVLSSVTASGGAAGYASRGADGVFVRDSTFRDADIGVRANGMTRVARNRIDARGVGVWIDGGAGSVVSDNHVGGYGRYGIVVTGPAFDHVVSGNALAGPDSVADLAWDGLGAGVCFSGNGPVRSDPPHAEAIYSCDLPATAGVPNPAVSAAMLG